MTSLACRQCGDEPRRRGFATCETCQSSTAPVCPEPARAFYDDSPSEPDWESIVADRYADSFDEDRAQDRADRAVYGD